LKFIPEEQKTFPGEGGKCIALGAKVANPWGGGGEVPRPPAR